LLLLHHGPSHGYTLLEQLTELGLGKSSSSVIYRTLRDMEAKGCVTSTWDQERTQGPPRRVYHLAPLGDELLSCCIEDLREARGHIDRLMDAYTRHMTEGKGEYHHDRDA